MKKLALLDLVSNRFRKLALLDLVSNRFRKLTLLDLVYNCVLLMMLRLVCAWLMTDWPRGRKKPRPRSPGLSLVEPTV